MRNFIDMVETTETSADHMIDEAKHHKKHKNKKCTMCNGTGYLGPISNEDGDNDQAEAADADSDSD